MLSTGVVLITEYARINNLSAFIGLALVLVVYLLGMGFVLDVVSLPVLGIAGGRSDCVWNLMICDVDATKVSQYLADDRIRDALESEPLRTRTGYWILRNSERIGFNWFAFLFAHPELDSRCVILLIGYNRKQFQIEGGRLAVNRLRGTMLSLVDLLNGKVAPDSSYSLDDFLQRYPNFVYRSDTAFHYALRPTEIPFRRLQKLSITAKAIIITILGTFTVSIILLAEGQINEAQAGLSLIPELALVGAEVLPLIPRRRRNR